MIGEIVFNGPGPFELPVPQSVSAKAEGGHICLSLSVLVGELGAARLETIRVPLVTTQAHEICAALSRAVVTVALPHEPSSA